MKILEGIVVSLKMNKTVVVEVTRREPDPLYKKRVKKSKKHKVELGSKELKIGDKVKIVETKPLSKDKHFKVLEEKVLEKEKKK